MLSLPRQRQQQFSVPSPSVSSVSSVHRFARLGLERILEVLARGDPELQAPSLALLQAILTVPHLRLGALPTLTHRSGFFAPLAALLQGPQSRQALQVRLSACSLGKVVIPER